MFIILQIFFATSAILKIGKYSRVFPIFSRGIVGHRDAFKPIARAKIFDRLKLTIIHQSGGE